MQNSTQEGSRRTSRIRTPTALFRESRRSEAQLDSQPELRLRGSDAERMFKKRQLEAKQASATSRLETETLKRNHAKKTKELLAFLAGATANNPSSKKAFPTVDTSKAATLSLGERCLRQLLARRYVCVFCQLFFSKGANVPFEAQEVLWQNVIKCGAPPEQLSPDLLAQYDVSDVTGIEQLKNCILSWRGIPGYNLRNTENTNLMETRTQSPNLSESLPSYGSPASPVPSECASTHSPNLENIDEEMPMWNELFANVGEIEPEPDLDGTDFDPPSLFTGSFPTFNFCSSCLNHLSKPECSTVPVDALANYHFFGELPSELERINLNDTMKFALAPGMPMVKIKVVYGSAKKLQGNVVVLDLGKSVGQAVLPFALRDDCDRLRIVVDQRLTAEQKERIRTMECVNVRDLEKLIDFFRTHNRFFQPADDSDIRRVAVDGKLNPVEETSDISGPSVQTNVLDDASPSTTFRYYCQPQAAESEDIDKLGLAEVETRTGTARVTPGTKFLTADEDGGIQKMFPYLFPFGFGLINDRRKRGKNGAVSFEHEIRRLLMDGSGRFNDFLLICVLFSTVKQKQISRSLYYRVQNMAINDINRITQMKPEEIKDALLRTNAHPSANDQNIALRTVAQAVGTSHGSDGERFDIRKKIEAAKKVLGGHTWFLSICPNIDRNNDLYRFLKDPIDVPVDYCYPGAVNLHVNGMCINMNGNGIIPSKEDCLKAAQSDIAGCVNFFQNLHRCFLSNFLGWDFERGKSRPGGGRLGEVEYFFDVMETNGRGVLHGHMVVRIKDTPRGRMDFNRLMKRGPKRFARDLIQYISRTVASSYGLELAEAECPVCGQQNTFSSFEQTSAAYSHKGSIHLPPPSNVKCSACATSCCSENVILHKAMSSLFPSETSMRLQNKTTTHSLIWEIEDTKTFVRELLFGKSALMMQGFFDSYGETKSRYWSWILAILFQNHACKHTTSCFKNQRDVCRFRFPRLLVQSTTVSSNGDVEICKSQFSEWLNSYLLDGLEIFRINQDATFLCSGTHEGTTVGIYCSKYAGKPQQPLDNIWVQLIVVHFLKKFRQRQKLGLAPDLLMPDEERTRAVHSWMRSLAWSLTSADELDPQMMVFHLLYGSPVITSHEFVNVPTHLFVNRLQSVSNPDVRYAFRGSRLQPAQDASLFYLNRPEADSDMPLIIYYALRKVQYDEPRFEAEMFQSSHPSHLKQRVVPSFQIPVVTTKRPNVNNLATKEAYFKDHSNCRRLGQCKWIGRVSLAYSPSNYQRFSETEEDVDCDAHDDISQEPDLDGNDDASSSSGFSFSKYWSKEEDDIDLDEADYAVQEDPCFESSIDHYFTDDDARSRWGAQTAVEFGTYRNVDELRCCPNESDWDMGNRILWETEQNSRKGDTYAKILMRFHSNVLEDERTRDDYAARREREKERASEALRLLQGMQNACSDNEFVRGDDEEHEQGILRSAAEELVHLELMAQLVNDAKVQQDHIARKMSPILAAVAGEVPILNLRCDQVTQTDLDVSLFYTTPQNLAMEVESDEGSLTDMPTNVHYMQGDVTDQLEQVASKNHLCYEQKAAFMVIGAKLLRTDFPDWSFTDLPFEATTEFWMSALHLIVAGKGGSGKSTLIDALRELVDLVARPKSILVVAYMGVAAANSGGTTIHSAGSLPLWTQRRVTKVGSKTRRRLEHVQLLIIDEYGTCGKILFARLDEIFRLVRGKPHDPFGGINVVLAGDHIQFGPTKDVSLHAKINPSHLHASRCTQADSVFELFNKVIILKYNFRASADPTYARLLQNLRTAQYFDNVQAMTKDLKLLNKRLVGETTAKPANTTVYPLFLVATNAERRSFTAEWKQSLAGRVTMYEWTRVPIGEDLTDEKWDFVEEFSWMTATNLKAHTRFWAFVGMPVVISTNIREYVPFGIATGAHGTIQSLHFSPSCSIKSMGNGRFSCSEPPLYVVINFETATPLQIPGFPPRCLPVGRFRARGTTQFKKQKLQDVKVKYDFWGLPIRHRFASTFHSVQCLTEENVLIGMPSTGFERHKMLYLGLSRAKGFTGVRLTTPYTVDMLQTFRPSDADVEVDRSLRKAHRKFMSSMRVCQTLQYKG